MTLFKVLNILQHIPFLKAKLIERTITNHFYTLSPVAELQCQSLKFRLDAEL